MSKTAIYILGCLMFSAAVAAQATQLSLVQTVNLPSQMSQSSCNFHPQGLGIDEQQQELLFFQQCSRPVVRSDLNGNYLGGDVSVGGYNHITSGAADSNYYYFSDYTANTSGLDLYRMNKDGTGITNISTEIQADGGYPIDVRNGLIYRTNFSTNYDWSDLNQIRVANVASPDSIIQTLNLTGNNGIGDIAIDTDHNSLWVLEWNGGRILRYNLSTGGAPLETFNLGLDGQDAGLTYFNNRLYYWDWVSGSGSTLNIYQLSDVGVVSIATPVPTLSDWGKIMLSMLLAVGTFFVLRRRLQ